MSTPVEPSAQNKSTSRRWSDRIFASAAIPPRASSSSMRTGSNTTNATRSVGHTESPKAQSGSPSRRLTTLPEVYDAFMEDQPTENPVQNEDSSDSDLHQRISHVHIQARNVWTAFDTYAQALEVDLQKLHDAVQTLGSSLDLAQSARRTRDCLLLVSWTIRENARSLFPSVVKRIDPPEVDDEVYITEPRHSSPWLPSLGNPAADVTESNLHTGALHDQLMTLAHRVSILRGALEQFPEFDNFRKRPLKSFEADLKYWSLCLSSYNDRYDMREVKIYIHDLSSELGKRFGEISRYINQYIAYVPNVRLSQQHAMSNLHTLATIATFFSAVTASTIQYTIGAPQSQTEDNLFRATLGLWFSSLVFSIACALNSFLALMWRSANYSAPEMRLPSWLWIWIRRCPTVFLLFSVVTFLAGLSCFTILTQPRITWIIVLVCEGFSSFTLAILLILLAVDKWSSYHTQRLPGFKLSLPQIFGEKAGNVLPTHIEHTASWSIGYLIRATGAMSSVALRLGLSRLRPNVQTSEGEKSHFTEIIISSPQAEFTPQARKSPSIESLHLNPAQQRWREAIKKVILLNRATQADTQSELLAEHMAALESNLKRISMTENPIQHKAGPATCDIKFNPEGTFLAICGKQSSMRWELGSLEPKKDHPFSVGQARQVTWTSCGHYLLTRTNRAVHVWTLSDDSQHTKRMITRYDSTSLIIPLPDMKTRAPPRFVSIEGSNKNKLSLLDVLGEEHLSYEFDNISIHYADIIPDSPCILLAVEVSHGQQGIKPMKASPIRKLIVFNLDSGKEEHDVPLWHELQHVTISGNGRLAVVTYKGYIPPQLWRVNRTKAGIKLDLSLQYCARERNSILEFDPTRRFYFSGRAHFLHNDRFVLCATTEGKLFFWRRDKPHPVHILGALTSDIDKPLQVACHGESENFLFATRSQDGKIRIWKAPGTEAATTLSGLGENALGLSTQDRASPLGLTESPQLEPEESPHLGTLPELSQEPLVRG
ncbi:hypothetical protein K439DRAFT_295077 [Ramaria rubella]|nr:hypothetical protein K439DRAFT_295077 [Ramaria rubella]